MLYLIGEEILKSSVSDGQALTGCRVHEGVAARHLLVRPALRSRAATPTSRPAGRNAQNDRGSSGRTPGWGTP